MQSVCADISYFENRLRYKFRNKSLLSLALTHRSFDKSNNERLEFLGDSILNFLIAEKLLSIFPDADEGQLSRLRAKMVSAVTLAEIGREIGINKVLFLGLGELKNKGHTNNSIQSDAVEAVIGAVFMDGGMEVCRSCVMHWFIDRISKLSLDDPYNKDSKTRLQEYLQSLRYSLPMYSVISQLKGTYSNNFIVLCEIKDMNISYRGEGTGRKAAEQEAAQGILNMIEQ